MSKKEKKPSGFLKNFGRNMAVYGVAKVAASKLEKHLEKEAGGRGTPSKAELKDLKKVNDDLARATAKRHLDYPISTRKKIIDRANRMAERLEMDDQTELDFSSRLLIYEDCLKESLKEEHPDLALKEIKVILKSRLHLIIDSYFDNDYKIELKEKWYEDLIIKSEKYIKRKEAQHSTSKVEKIDFIDMPEKEKDEILQAEILLDNKKQKISFHEINILQINLESLLKKDFPELSKSDRFAMLKERLNRIINHAEKKKDKTLENEEWFKKLLLAVEEGNNQPQESTHSKKGEINEGSKIGLKAFISLRRGKLVIAFFIAFTILMIFDSNVGAFAILAFLLFSIYLIFDWLIKLIKNR